MEKAEEIRNKINECEKRKKEYCVLLKNIDLTKLAYARSIAAEITNIKELKKELKSKEGEKQ